MNTSDNLPATTETDFNAVNELMTRVDAINAKTPTELTDGDLAVLVAYYRRQRQKRAAGIKPARTKAISGASAIPLSELLNLAPVKPAPRLTSPSPSPSTTKPGSLRRSL